MKLAAAAANHAAAVALDETGVSAGVCSVEIVVARASNDGMSAAKNSAACCFSILFGLAAIDGGQTSFSSENTARCCANANMVSAVRPASSTTEPAIQTSSKNPYLPKAHGGVAVSMSDDDSVVVRIRSEYHVGVIIIVGVGRT